ncbi:hypothetical protein R3P38DRAFT_227308 [Favolaschia claudopus]|uniref:Uncharacterized protein n=1 Tax=Favolaschia claudopus TaxID=2862362 RepID=A0AAV9ZU95_9AGAR
MAAPDWSKTDVHQHYDSPWLTLPPSEQALSTYRPKLGFHPSPVRDPEDFAAQLKKRTLFGHPRDVVPEQPNLDEFLYLPEELSPAPPPVEQTLIPPSPSPNDPPPPNHFLYPKAGIFKLRKTSAFQRGYVYTTPYNRENSIATDHYRMLHVATPPQLTPRRVLDPATQQLQYCHDPVPDCIQMVPGVPYAFEIDGNPNELHTIGAVHTFESLRHEHDFCLSMTIRCL